MIHVIQEALQGDWLSCFEIASILNCKSGCDYEGKESGLKKKHESSVHNKYSFSIQSCKLTVCYERRRACNRDKRWTSRSAENYKAHFIYAKKFGTDQSIGNEAVKEVIREESMTG